MTARLITATTPAGGRLFAVVQPSLPAGVRGSVAHSATVAGVAPFASDAAAIAAIAALEKLRGRIDPAAAQGDA